MQPNIYIVLPIFKKGNLDDINKYRKEKLYNTINILWLYGCNIHFSSSETISSPAVTCDLPKVLDYMSILLKNMNHHGICGKKQPTESSTCPLMVEDLLIAADVAYGSILKNIRT